MIKYSLSLLIIWASISFSYIYRTPLDFCSNDAYEHRQYVKIISNENRLPKPYEDFVTYHPPLYYLIGNYISFPDKSNEDLHVKSMKLISSTFGVISLFIIFWILNSLYKEVFINFLVTAFIATTPKFFFTFNSYSNDSLTALSCISIIALSYKISQHWSSKLAILLFLAATIGVYTKYNSLWCFAIVFIFCLRGLFIKFTLPRANDLKIIFILTLAIISFLPWAYFHNYKYTNKLFPIRKIDEPYIIQTIDLPERIKTIRSIFNLSFFNLTKFRSPFVHPMGGEYTKKNDYLSYSFLTSIIGEYQISNPHIYFVLLIIWVHLYMYLLSLKEIFKSSINKASFTFILLSHLIQIINVARLKTFYGLAFFLDYRFIIWSTICWGILYSSAIVNRSKINKYKYTIILFIGILVQVYFLTTVIGNDCGPTLL